MNRSESKTATGAGGQGNLTRSAGIVSIGVMVSRVLGLVREMVLAYLLDTRLALDAFYAAFRVPNLERRYLVELTDGGRETALLIPSQGIMGFKIQGQTRRIRPVVRLFDPTSARLVQEIAPAAGPVQFFTSRVQNGMLIVTTSSGKVFGYAPR